MNKEFVQGVLEKEVQDGVFGEYLKNPLDGKERAKIVGCKMMFCRKKAGLSQRDVCTIIGCAPQTYSGYENGKHEPTIETLVRLSHLYNVSLDFLLEKDPEYGFRNFVEQEEYFNPALAEIGAEVQAVKDALAEMKEHIKITE